MLSLNFEIHQDGKDAENQARGVVAALVAIYGPQIMPTTPRYTAPASQVIAQSLNRPEWATPAPDGYPVEAEQPADADTSNLSDFALHRDTAGIPWDERIHASTKTTNKDGTWTRRRNTPDEVFDKVMAELKAANTAMTLEAAAGLTAPTPESPQPSAAEAFTPPPSVVIPAYSAPVADPSSQTVPAVPVTVPQPPAPPAPMVPTPPAAASDASAEPVEIMKAVNAKTAEKRLNADKLQEIMGKAGLDGLAKVFTAPIEARRTIAAELAAL